MEPQTKLDALKTLIKASVIIAEPDKPGLLAKLATMSEEEVDALGKFLSVEQDEIDKKLSQDTEGVRNLLQRAQELDSTENANKPA